MPSVIAVELEVRVAARAIVRLTNLICDSTAVVHLMDVADGRGLVLDIAQHSALVECRARQTLHRSFEFADSSDAAAASA